MTCEDLLAAGWKEFSPNAQLDRWDRGFQLRVRNERGDTLYFIQVYFWRHSKYGRKELDGFEIEMAVNDGCRWFATRAAIRFVAWSGVEAWTPQQAADWGREIFGRLECVPYDSE